MVDPPSFFSEKRFSPSSHGVDKIWKVSESLLMRDLEAWLHELIKALIPPAPQPVPVPVKVKR
jgi:hypothetical protein